MSKEELLMTKFRVETSLKSSGTIFNKSKIDVLKECDYYIKQRSIDGNAPKQFIKAYFYRKNSRVRRKKLKSWVSYIAKFAEKWYPHESIIEFLINRIGQAIGIEMNNVKLVIGNGQIRFLSEYFLNKNELLIHGAEICGEYLGDLMMAKEIAVNKNTARDLFTFEFIKKSIETVYPNNCKGILLGLIKMVTFDALVGNNDRHFYNWGVIDYKKKTQKQPKFAPVYDSARALMWNISDENIVHYYRVHKSGGRKVLNYLKNAKPRISIEDNKEANHFELMKFLKNKNPHYSNLINEIASKQNERKVLELINKEFEQFFIKERSYLIKLIIKLRFEKIRSI